MGTNRKEEVTHWLRLAASGDSAARENLYEEVYGELRRMAAGFFQGQAPGHTLQPTALVHEAFLRLARSARFEDRVHFLASAAIAMRQVLLDHAKRRRRAKRGGEWRRVTLAEGLLPGRSPDRDILDLEEALVRLASLDPRQGRIVEIRFFGGLTVDEIATVLGLGKTTIEGDWRMARAWLVRELAKS